jgi:hypothetical protein
MDFDDIRLAQFEQLKQDWVKLCSTSSAGICALANAHRKRDDCLLRSMHCGSFNFSFRLHWDDGGEDWLIRFPLPGKSMFLDEKVRREAVLMKYLAQNTQIPVPRVISYGASDDNPTGLGPFILMTWVEGRKMSEVLRKHSADTKEDVLDPDIDPQTLQILYEQMAEIMVELWNLDFTCIGSLGYDEAGGTWSIDGRPLTLEMNELIRTCGLPNDCIPNRTYRSSTDYIFSLLELQSTHLERQRNSVYDSVDCREKYACRHLIKAVALNFVSRTDNYGPFKLFSDDLCPGNVLVDEHYKVTGVIDWEFCYAAPSQLAGSVPWWLLLQRPHRLIIELGTDAFFEAYLPKAEIFLQAVELKEKAKGIFSAEGGLSARMRQSLQSKSTWFTLACRMVSSVDLLYWDLLDEFCWGPRSSVAERVHSFTTKPAMHRDREKLVRHKIQQLREYYAELGEGTTVDYEEDTFRKPELQAKSRPDSTTQETKGLAFLLAPFTALHKTLPRNNLQGKLVVASSISLLSLVLALAISTSGRRARR